MSALCHKKNPLIRNGTNRWGRFLKALSPDSVKVDGRSAADMVMFAKRLSEEITFYPSRGASTSDWMPFFGQNLTALLARSATLPVESFRRFSQNVRAFLLADPKRSKPQLRNHFQLLFYLPVALLQETGEIYESLPRDHSLRRFMEKVLVRDIEIPLRDLISFYKGALSAQGKIFTDGELKANNYNVDFDGQDSRIQLPSVVTERIIPSEKMSDLFIAGEFLERIHSGGWASLYAATDLDANPYRASVGKLHDQIFDALTYNLVTKAFDRLFQALERVARESDQYLNENLTAFDSHPSHYALWLTFLRLFNFSQNHLNTLTKRHLDYYYTDVLQLDLRKGEPNKVHLLFELNKNSPGHLLPRETTLFKGGKDDFGNEVSYQLDEDFVVNRAKIESLKSLFRPTFQYNTFDYYLPFSASVTNSKDGIGEALPKEFPHWKPFGPFNKKANARIGFALADKQLFLREGKRVVKIVVALDSELALSSLPLTFTASFTTKDGWFEVSDYSKLKASTQEKNSLVLEITLHGEDPPVIPYDPGIHEEGFSTADPVVKIEFGFGKTFYLNFFSTLIFPFIRDLTFENIELSVSVEGVRNVTLQNELGVLDTSKPFLPFGPTPVVNSSLMLGSSELFSKKLQDMSLRVEWEQTIVPSQFFIPQDPIRFTRESSKAISNQLRQFEFGKFEEQLQKIVPPRASDYKARLLHLKSGVWERASNAYEVKIFEDDGFLDIPDLEQLSHSIPQTLENVPYSTTSSAGFIRLELNKDFGHKQYPRAYAEALVRLANKEDVALPNEPYTPKITDFTVSYATQVDFPSQVFHLYPFGLKKIGSSNDRLFPELSHEGELYIGVKDLEPPQRLSMLFQTIDGSANPLKPENPLEWAYLRDDDWVNFKDQEVDDKTHNLTGSGIIGLAVPEGANTTHSILPSGLYWFRMAVKEHADALNDLLSIDAQAATATFLPNNNDPQFLSRSLEPGTISKLKISQGAIKKIAQPYTSFGGKSVETRDHFYVRVSERLRHKDRASTMWDYEHLVLEYFSDVYKVKCINHTELCRDLKQQVIADNELKPGHVLVVPIPFVTPGSVRNPLRPYMDKKTITAIDRFLRTRISPFIQLEVQNPKIEEVQIQCQVAFTDKIADKAFYKEELQQAIIRYLTPWAYGEGVEISFGGRWHKSAIINFVEEQDYVDFVKDFEMYHKADSAQLDNEWTKIDQEVIQATTARSILVSHATHAINDLQG